MAASESKKPYPRWFYAILALLPLLSIGLVGGFFLFLMPKVFQRPLNVESPKWDLSVLTEADPILIWSNRKNLSTIFLHAYGEETRYYPVHTNRLGLRGPDIQEKGDRLRILALGDSTTFGMGVGDDQAWCAVLQAILDPDAKLLEVLNGGCIGYSLAQSRKFLELLSPLVQPDIILLTTGHNEITAWANASDSDTLASKRFPLRTKAYKWLRRELFPNTNEDADRPRMTPGEFLDGLMDFAAMCRKQERFCWFLLWPWKQKTFAGPDDTLDVNSYHTLIREAGSRARVNVVDLGHAFRTVGEDAYIPGDIVHATEAGNRAVAEYLAGVLRKAFQEDLCEGWQEAAMSHARALLASNRSADAQDFLERYLNIVRQGTPYELLGDACRELGDREAALRAWWLGMETDPLYAPNFDKAAAVMSQRDAEQQIAFWNKVCNDLPHAHRAWMMLGKAFEGQRRWSEAADAYRIAVQAGPVDAGPHVLLGLALLTTEDWTGAIDALERALAINPEIPDLQEQIGAARRAMEATGRHME